jgi:hypothetical protein
MLKPYIYGHASAGEDIKKKRLKLYIFLDKAIPCFY